MSPQKSREQVLKNYRKNRAFYALVRFVVTTDDHARQLAEILGGEGTADPAKYRIDVVEYGSLNVIEPRDVRRGASEKAPEPGEPLGVAEEAVLSCIVGRGFRSRDDVARELRGKGVTISARSVSRVLKSLVGKGLLTKVGNAYEPTDSARARSRQDTL